MSALWGYHYCFLLCNFTVIYNLICPLAVISISHHFSVVINCVFFFFVTLRTLFMFIFQFCLYFCHSTNPVIYFIFHSTSLLSCNLHQLYQIHRCITLRLQLTNKICGSIWVLPYRILQMLSMITSEPISPMTIKF